tara:strand:- start:71 stop:487 length:417 start_codon:yes stop_codon:yes gene_type:complete
MFDVIGRKSLETSVLSAILFYVFANPSTYKMVKKIPGFKFVMKSTTEITHSGVLAHALIFGVVFLGCVWLINNTMLNQYFDVVEGFKEHITENENVDSLELKEYDKIHKCQKTISDYIEKHNPVKKMMNDGKIENNNE